MSLIPRPNAEPRRLRPPRPAEGGIAGMTRPASGLAMAIERPVRRSHRIARDGHGSRCVWPDMSKARLQAEGSLHQIQVAPKQGRMRPVLRAQFPANDPHVIFHNGFILAQELGNFLVRAAIGRERQDLSFRLIEVQ
jgi:hypothetical protein